MYPMKTSQTRKVCSVEHVRPRQQCTTSQHDTNPMPVQCWATITGAGQHQFNTGQWIMLPWCRMSLRCRPTHPIPVHCWHSIELAMGWDGGPTFAGQSSTTQAQPYSNSQAHHASRGSSNAGTPSEKLSTTLTSKQNSFDITPASTTSTGRLTNVDPMLIRRVWWWPNNNPTLAHFS